MDDNHSYESAQSRAKWVQGLFITYIILYLIEVPLLIMENSSLSNPYEIFLNKDSTYFTVVKIKALLALFQIPLFIAMIVAFCMWVHRIHRNLSSLGAKDLKFTPGWAVGYYFIPIANLFQPFRATQEAWKASDPSVETKPNTSWKSQTAPGFILAWWLVFIVSNILSNSAFRMSLRLEETIENMIFINNMYLFSDLVDIVSALLAMFVVWKLTARQEERHRLLSQSGESQQQTIQP
ncbi:DUF4328 domain-containing protein [Melghirimyces algeriensis]|uniref:DUF4328 domain-containing protein n=1 Tax=Melghirimyces algeriensis TaxID=910412 RepID=A0A521FBW8_9BACL|nr:DUF4328 domain-containing protein [Melghirimyces algeriensis]SMO93574.1 protein of unknown function [Melghirimyces algeriensis]